MTGLPVLNRMLLAFHLIFLYTHHSMPLSPETMRTLLAVCMVAMALLALLFLRRRELTTLEIVGWGMLILLLPLLGPFLVIWLHPGSPRPHRRFKPGQSP
ncbi:MAG: hypothetical protein ACWGO1_04795 [Anaerolineales bacterium]